MSGLSPHPLPPRDLATRALPIVFGTQPLFQIHDATQNPLFFGRLVRHRFDAPGSEYGVLYAGIDPYAAFVETFGRLPQGSVVTRAALAGNHLAEIAFQPPLRFVDLSGTGLARLGADGRLGTGDYAIAQQWSLALWRHPEQPDGMYYRSRHDPSRQCAAIFDRPGLNASVTPLGSLLAPSSAALLASILDTYGFGLIETHIHKST